MLKRKDTTEMKKTEFEKWKHVYEQAELAGPETPHTPLPWTTSQNLILDAKGDEIAHVSYEQSGYVQANLRLMVAAPELFEALDAALTWWHDNPKNIYRKELVWLEPARQALAKARGKE